ncbi:MAG TPA: hypothetical protein VF171_02865 [Trueperaceae bacterium]
MTTFSTDPGSIANRPFSELLQHQAGGPNSQPAWGYRQFQMQESLSRRDQERQFAEAMQQQALQSVANPLQAVALIGRKFFDQWAGRRKDAALSDQLQEYFAAEEQQRVLQAQQAEAERQRLRQEALQDYGTKQRIKAEHNGPPDAIRTLQHLAGDPRLAALDRQRKQAGAPSVRVNNNQPAVQPFAEKSYEQMQSWEQGARVAQETLSSVSEVRSILDQMDGGRMEQAISYLQEFTPGFVPKDKAEARQAFLGATRPMMAQALEMMRGLGPMTEKEFQAATAALPKFGLEKGATEYLTNLFERKAQTAIGTYESALQYTQTPEFGTSGFLRFRPQYTTTAPPIDPKSGRLRFNIETGEFE